MLRAFVCALVALHACFRGVSPRFLGCFRVTSSSSSSSSAVRNLRAGGGVRDLDPASCSVRCLDEGYQVAALSSNTCYCGNRLNGLVVTECFNTSSKERTKDEKRGSERQSGSYLPPAQEADVSLSRTEGVSLHSLNVSACPDGVQTGDSLLLQVSGHLAGRPCQTTGQPTGIVGLEGTDVSEVTVEFQGMPPKGQSSRRVKVLGDGSFCASAEWTLKTPGSFQINVRASNVLSTLSCTLHLSVSQPPAGSSGTSVPPAVPSCVSSIDNVVVCLPVSDENLCGSPPAVSVELLQKHLDRNIGRNGPKKLSSKTDDRKLSNTTVRIHAAKQAYPTNAEITFQAVVEVLEPAEFVWHFGDSTTAKTSIKTISKKYKNPGSYDVVVVASGGGTTVASDAFPLVVQRPAKLNRLVHQASVLQGQTVRVSCRVNAGTDLTFAWSFGDGTSKLGQSVEEHVFNRTGEFRVEVTASNLVSSASLTGHIFVVNRPCQPPPVKNMGPHKLKVRRYEVVRLGVTYEKDLDCDASEGLNYSWTLLDSAGRVVPLPPADTHEQSLELRSHFLQYDTYTSIAKVQVVGTEVYSNYTVRVQVMASQPVAFIQGGTNVFISRSSDAVTLDGEASHDPDFPMSPLSYSWTCKPVSSISTSCFDRHIRASSPALRFPVASLKRDFDQFRFTLTVYSGERSASADAFVTLSSNLVGRASIHCPRCRGDQVNWDQPFSVSASCRDCNAAEHLVQYSWSLNLVNASSKPPTEGSFCYTSDLGAPSAVVENPTQTHSTHDERFDGATSRKKRGGLSQSAPSAGPLHPDDDSDLYLDHCAQPEVIGEFPGDPDSSADGEFYFPLLESGRVDSDYDVHFANAEEGDPGVSAGRPSGVDEEGFTAAEDSMFYPPLLEEEGSNLLHPKPAAATREPNLLDLRRDPIDTGLFESYTDSGISSSVLSLRPFSLRPMSRYMLEVTAKSQNSLVGRAQLFVRTGPAPEATTCQVQPGRGTELHTLFSIFCTSGREDLLYQYSYSVGGKPPRMLYQGRDFQYYFSLPSGDPSDGYKVTIYTEIRSSTHGSATKPCPVTVQVQPSFLRNASSSSPDEELLESGRRNLTTLLQLRNNVETRNYVSLLTSVLNRLSVDSEGDTHTQTHTRNLLIHTVCDLQGSGEASMIDSIGLLEDLLLVTNQVTLTSARRVTARVQQISEQFTESGSQRLHEKTLSALISLLSLSLQVATSCEAHSKYPPQSGSSTGGNFRDFACTPEWVDGRNISRGNSGITRRVRHLMAEILQTASALVLKSLLSHESRQLTVRSGLLSFHAAPQNQTSTVVTFGSSTFYMPASLIQAVFGHRSGDEPACILRVTTEFTRSPYTWATAAAQLNGPVVELSLYRCSTRRKIPIRSLAQPISIVLTRPQRNSSTEEFSLLRDHINYHSFNITEELLQQVIQLTVIFTQPSNNEAFPVMLLLSPFEKPTPSVHHLYRIHRWKSNTARITLPSSHLNAAGVAHLALLHADFGKTGRNNKQQSGGINYSLSVVSSQCLFWNDQQRAWTHRGCRTQQTDTSPAVNCSCHLLRPVTVVQQQIQSSHETAEVDPFLSVPSDLTVLSVLLLALVLSVPALLACQRADAASEGNRGVHFLPDNSPSDPHLYAVTVHTGLRSAARMSAKVYIVLHGEDRCSQTKELQVPGCTLFRRNSQDTFILSAADNLGSVWGAHIWHDNSGPSPDWYLRHVEVSEISRGHGDGRTWLMDGQCWLTVTKADGRVERMLRVNTEGFCFTKMLRFKLSDYFSDFHIWASVYSCPSPSSFTHTQRLSVCLLLLLGYACVNAVIISQMDVQLGLEQSFIGVLPVSVITGLVSAAVVLPVATWTSFLFRLCGAKPTGSGVQDAKSRVTDVLPVTETGFEPNLSLFDLYQWTQEASINKNQQDTDLLPLPSENLSERHKCSSIGGSRNVHRVKGRFTLTSQRRCCLTWAFCLLSSLCCLVLSAVQGKRFSSSDVLLWLQSLFVSLMSCVFLIHPAVIFTVAVTVSWWRCRKPSLQSFHSEALKKWSHKAAEQHEEQLGPSAFSLKSHSYLEKRLEARQRARFLRHLQPPAPATLRETSRRRRRDELIRKTLRELCFCASMLVLMVCITYGCSHRDHCLLNRAVAKQFIRKHHQDFMSIQKCEQWRTWTQTRLLDLLYNNPSAQTETRILIGDPILQKTEMSNIFQSLVSMETRLRTCSHLDCSSGPTVTVGLGRTRSDAASRLERLFAAGWLDGPAAALKVRFTLYSPAPDLFTSVTLLAEQSPSGVLLPSVKVQSVGVYHTPAVWDYVVQVLFLLLSLLRLCHQVSNVWQEGLLGYGRRLSNWAEVSLLTVTLLYYVRYIRHATFITEVVDLLQRHSYKGAVDVGQLAASEQFIRTLQGILLFLLTTKCATVLGVIVTSTALSSLMWPVVSGLIFLTALSCSGTLLYGQNWKAFSSIPRSVQTLLSHYWGPRTAKGPLQCGSDSLSCAILYLSSTLVWTAMVVAVMSSFIRRAKQSYRKRRDAFTFAELMVYVKKRISGIKSQHEQQSTDNLEMRKTFYLEECESLVDELLFRLGALSDSLHQTLPPKGDRGVDSPAVSSLDTQNTVKSQSESAAVLYSSHQFRLDIDVASEDELKQTKHWTEDVPEEQSDQLVETQTTQTEVVVVEVLVHDGPERIKEYFLQA